MVIVVAGMLTSRSCLQTRTRRRFSGGNHTISMPTSFFQLLKGTSGLNRHLPSYTAESQFNLECGNSKLAVYDGYEKDVILSEGGLLKY